MCSSVAHKSPEVEVGRGHPAFVILDEVEEVFRSELDRDVARVVRDRFLLVLHLARPGVGVRDVLPEDGFRARIVPESHPGEADPERSHAQPLLVLSAQVVALRQAGEARGILHPDELHELLHALEVAIPEERVQEDVVVLHALEVLRMLVKHFFEVASSLRVLPLLEKVLSYARVHVGSAGIFGILLEERLRRGAAFVEALELEVELEERAQRGTAAIRPRSAFFRCALRKGFEALHVLDVSALHLLDRDTGLSFLHVLAKPAEAG
jgi:hypothetical protein